MGDRRPQHHYDEPSDSPAAPLPSLELWVKRILGGDTRALARAITAIENSGPESAPLLKALFPHSGRATVVGITGSPGVGKSTLVDQLAHEYRRRKLSVGIVAVDPSSPYTGGAILGDRIRMQSHHADQGIYIRSMATRGSLGGLARTTADVATALDASGKDVVLIETVGVGQDEIDIMRLSDITVVILVPGMGDDVQSIKAGIMEIADIFVINKADRPGGDRVEKEIRALQSLASRGDHWVPPIVKTIATEGSGIDQLRAAIADYEQFIKKEELWTRKRRENWAQRLMEMTRQSLLERVVHRQLAPGQLEQYAADVVAHRRDPYTLVEEMIAHWAGPAQRDKE